MVTGELRRPSTGDLRTASRESPAETAFKKFVDGACACTDMTCVEERQEQWAREGAVLARQMTSEEAAAMAKKMEPLTTKFMECVERIARDQAGSP